jgi:hypothetical protein
VAARNLIEHNRLVSVPTEMSLPWIDLPNLCARVRTSAVQFSSLKSLDARLTVLEQFSLLAILVLAPIGWGQIARTSLVCEAVW